jgi:hypothetical protein
MDSGSRSAGCLTQRFLMLVLPLEIEAKCPRKINSQDNSVVVRNDIVIYNKCMYRTPLYTPRCIYHPAGTSGLGIGVVWSLGGSGLRYSTLSTLTWRGQRSLLVRREQESRVDRER